MSQESKSRRMWLLAAGGAAGALAAGKAATANGLVPPDLIGPYAPGNALTYAAHRLFGRNAMAREFAASEISAAPFANGRPPKTDAFAALQSKGFADWRLQVDGLVEQPLSLSLADIRAFGSSSQITHLACEEGWSYIAQWTGARVADVLAKAGVRPQGKYVVYRSMQEGWWDSIDMDEATHPQTLVAYGMNGKDMPTAFGGPLRMRVPRQLGYKSVKYLQHIHVTDDLKKVGNGLGAGGPEFGYSWFAGI